MRHLVLVFLIFISTITFSQTITGKVSDNLGSVAFADVILKDTNNTIVTGTTTNDDGTFSIKTTTGDYMLIVSFLGYENWTKSISLTTTIDLGTILLKEDSQTLDEVVIKSKKRVIERKVDRLVFNVEKSIVAATGTAEDILKIAPRVQIQNGAIEIIGKGNARVLINGRLSPLEGEDLIDFLNGLGANEIKSIEVITNPPAKYEASGNGGLINIILKKGALNTWKNVTTLMYNQNKYNFGNFRNNFFLNKNKISLSASINATKGNFENAEGLQIFYPTNFWDINIDNKSPNRKYSGRFLIDYEVSDKTTIGLQYLSSLSKPGARATITSSIFDVNNKLERTLVNKGAFDVNDHINSINFHSITAIDSIGKRISLDVDYFKFKSDSKHNFITESFDENNIFTGLNSAGLNITDQEINNFSSKIDVEYPIKKVNLSFGVKASFTETKSSGMFFNNITGEPILDKSISNEFMYNEDNLAAYISGNTNLNEKLQVKFGLRVESTKTKGENTTINQINKNEYTKLFPTLYFAYEKNESNSFGFSYGKRINRPGFGNLNPFRIYINDNSYSEGNPFLQPSFTDNFEFSHSYKKNTNTSVFLNITNDGSGTLFTPNETNQIQIVTRENYYNQYSFGISESFSYNKISWWNNQNSVSIIGYKTTFTKDFGSAPKNGTLFTMSSNNTFTISENTKFQINSWYRSKHSNGLFSVGEMYDLSFGLQHHFKKSNIKVSLLANDVLNTASLNNYKSVVNGIEQVYRQNRSSRNFEIGIFYTFGNNKIKENKRGFGNDDEQNRSN